MIRRNRIRVVVLMTHPVQYLSPWFRYLHARVPSLDVHVVYATEPSAEQQGVGFGRAFEWDVPLRDGYESVVVRPSFEGMSIASDDFMGLDVPEVVDVVRRLEPDVAVVSGWHSVTQVRAIYALRRAGIPLLYRGDTHLGSRSVRWPLLSRARARLMLRQFTGYLAVGARSRQYLLAMGVADPAIVSSPHAVDNESFGARAAVARQRREEIRRAYGFGEQQRVVLYAGKLLALKRPEDLLAAARQLHGGAVLFVGDGPERKALEARARDIGVTAVFAGFLNQRQMADAYVAADALVVPGRETWGLVVNEALACGLPVVMSSNVGASSDLTLPPASVTVVGRDGFATAIASVIDHRRQRGGSPEECQAAIRAFSFEAAARGLVTAATFAMRQKQARSSNAGVRVVALCGNLVFAGGMERITFEALSGLRRCGADVHVLLNGWSSRPIAELTERGELTWEVGFYNAPLNAVFRSPVRFMRALGDVALASAHLCQLWLRGRLTHVFAADFRTVLLHAPALAGCRLLGIPVLLRSGVAPTATPLHGRLWRWIIGPLVTRHIANSAFTAQELRAIGMAAERIITIPNVAPTREAVASLSPRDSGRIAYVGQIIPEKGVLQLIDAVGLMVACGHDVRLDIAGAMEGWAPDAVRDYRAAVRARAAQPDLLGRIRFLGWREDINAVLQGANLHCCPSQPEQREGFGITVIEAKRAGLPSVVCPSGALPELIDHQRDGWVARGFDAPAIAEGLQWLLADPQRLSLAQEAAGKSAERFDPHDFTERWRELFGLVAATPLPQTDVALPGPIVERVR